MKMMQFGNVKVKDGKGASLVVPPATVREAGASEPWLQAEPALAPTGSESGGNLPRATAPAHQERRHLQDFLSAFV